MTPEEMNQKYQHWLSDLRERQYLSEREERALGLRDGSGWDDEPYDEPDDVELEVPPTPPTVPPVPPNENPDDAKVLDEIFEPDTRTAPTKPAELLPLLPAGFKSYPNWVWWQLQTVDGRPTKVPLVLGESRPASSMNPADWRSFADAVAANITLGPSQGLGFMMGTKQNKTGLAGADLDGCRNPQTGDLTDWAQKFLTLFPSYAEVTPSRSGIRIYYSGEIPADGRKVFTLATSAGFGDKVRIEAFDSARYFTITGDRIGSVSEIAAPDIKQVLELCSEIKQQHPVQTKAQRGENAPESENYGTVQIQYGGKAITTKLELLLHGEIKSQLPFIVEDAFQNKIEYPSQSEADMALATLLALTGKNPEQIDEAFRESALYRGKWERDDYRDGTIKKATTTAEKMKAKTQPILVADSETIDDKPESRIPAFDPSVITGVHAKIVELICRGTTLVPQYAFLISKVVMGALMASKVRFKDLDDEPRIYAALIGETGSGKGTAWKRMEQILESLTQCGIKIINSTDSGAGLRDAFFDEPLDWPILCYVDEISSLGNKASDTRHPEILDAILELADSKRVSRVLARKGKSPKAAKTKDDCRLVVVMCGQNGDVYAKALSGRTELGAWDRLRPEFSVAVEPGRMPPIPKDEAARLMLEILSLPSCVMDMTSEARAFLESFWAEQPRDIKKKVRLKRNVELDSYQKVWGEGRSGVEVDDIKAVLKNFNREMIIRQVCFGTQISDRISFYLERIKRVTAWMRERIAAGSEPAAVAQSRRDYERRTNAARDNEEHIFDRAWLVHVKTHLDPIQVRKANGQVYDRFVPKPD